MRTMASIFELELFRKRKPAVSISIGFPIDDAHGGRFLNCPQPSYETQTE